MRTIVIKNGIAARGIGVIFLFVFLWFFIYILILFLREKELQKKRMTIRDMIQQGQRIRKKTEMTDRTQQSKIKEVDEWKEGVRQKVKNDIGFFRR